MACRYSRVHVRSVALVISLVVLVIKMFILVSCMGFIIICTFNNWLDPLF